MASLGVAGSETKALMLFEAQRKSVGAAYLLWIFLGGAGGHRFYLGRPGTGFLMLVGLVFGLVAGPILLLVIAVIALIDAFRIPSWTEATNTKLALKLAPAAPVDQIPPPVPPSTRNKQNRETPKATPIPQGSTQYLFGAIALTAAFFVMIAIVSKKIVQPHLNVNSSDTRPTVVTNNSQSATAAEKATKSPDQAPAVKGSNVVESGWTSTMIPAPLDVTAEPAAQKTAIVVPTDERATYFAESIAKLKPGRVRIVSRRHGPSGTSYQNRECDCGNATYRTLGDGTTLAEMKASRSDTKMTSLVMSRDGNGSISFHVCEHACAAIGAKLNRSRTTNPLGL